VRQANIVRTSRNEALVYSMMTQVTLEGCLFFVVKTDCVIRASFKTILTPCACIIVENYNSILPLGDCRFGASLGAWGFVTMLTHRGTVQVYKLISLHAWTVLLYVNELDLVIVFLFAGDFARSAAPTQLIVYDQSVFVHLWGLLHAFSG